MSSGLITHATTAAMAEISSPLDSMDFGTFEYRGHLWLHRSSGAVAQPGSLQPGSPPGLGGFTRGGHNSRIDARLGSGVRGNASCGAVVGASDPMAHKPLGTGSSLLALKEFLAQLERQHVLIRTDNTSVVSYIIARAAFVPGLCASRQRFYCYGRILAFSPSEQRNIPGLLNRGADMLSRRRIPQGEWRLHPESVQMIWNLYGEAEVDLFATSENAHYPLFFSLSHSPLRAHNALASSQALCVSSDQNIASGVMQDQGGASVSDTHSPELAEPALVPRPDRAVGSTSLADSGQEGHAIPGGTARCGTRTRNYGTFMCGCFRVIRGAKCITVSRDRHTHGSASTLYKTFVCLKMGSVCEMVPSGSYRPGYVHRVGCSEFPAVQAGGMSIRDICVAAGWSSQNTFATFYKAGRSGPLPPKCCR